MNKGVLLGDIGRGDLFLELLFPRSYFLEWGGWGKKGGGYSLLRTFSFFLKYSDLSRAFSEENIFKKSMSFFGGTKHGKISSPKQIRNKKI